MFVFLYKWKRDVNKERSSLIKRRDVAGPPNPSIIAHALSSLRCHDAPPYSLIDMSHDPELSLTRTVYEAYRSRIIVRQTIIACVKAAFIHLFCLYPLTECHGKNIVACPVAAIFLKQWVVASTFTVFRETIRSGESGC